MLKKKSCPNCQRPLDTELAKVEKRLELEVWSCSNCHWSRVKQIKKDLVKDIPTNLFIKKRNFAKQKLKIRLVEKLAQERYGDTRIWIPTEEVIDILISRKSLKNQSLFNKVLAHELAHASEQVRFHLQYNPHSLKFAKKCLRCKEAHPGLGHDEIWHDKYDEFLEEVKKQGKN